MTGEKYKDIDVPFCCRCSRFMVIHLGLVWIALNHELDDELMVRVGDAYKCPECGCKTVYKWKEYFETDTETLLSIGYWTMFLEDHSHYYKHHAKK